MLQRRCCLNNAPTKLMRGDYIAVCIYQFPLSYLTRTSMRCPTKRTTALTTVMSPESASLCYIPTFVEVTFALSLHLGLLPEQWRLLELSALIENVGHI